MGKRKGAPGGSDGGDLGRDHFPLCKKKQSAPPPQKREPAVAWSSVDARVGLELAVHHACALPECATQRHASRHEVDSMACASAGCGYARPHSLLHDGCQACVRQLVLFGSPVADWYGFPTAGVLAGM